jgi:dihydroorotase
MLTLRDARLADGRRRDVRVDREAGVVDAVGESLAAEETLDVAGKLLLPGMVDTHVHFREPGAAHKETWATGSRSAAAGGVTTVVDQPNTDPPTVTGAAFDRKAELATRSLVDFGLNGGVTADWVPDALFARPLFALGEVFLADSTGEMGIDADLFADAVAAAAQAGVTVTVHAEDAGLFEASALPDTGTDADPSEVEAWSAYRPAEAEVAAVERALSVGAEADATLHVAHTSTPAAVDLVAATDATCEVTPHHLFLSTDDRELGTFGRMNPPLRSEERRRGLFERTAEGAVDVVATDHAPHTRAEKDAPLRDAPSGVPGVETALPLLLAAAADGRLSHERVRDLTAANPAAVFDLPRKGRVEAGRDADLVLVPDDTRPIRAADLHSKCEWTPFEGMPGVFPEWTMVRGTVVYADSGSDLPAGLAPEGEFGPAAGSNVRT